MRMISPVRTNDGSLDSIVEIFPTHNTLSSPACSLDRLRVNQFGDHDTCVATPRLFERPLRTKGHSCRCAGITFENDKSSIHVEEVARDEFPCPSLTVTQRYYLRPRKQTASSRHKREHGTYHELAYPGAGAAGVKLSGYRIPDGRSRCGTLGRLHIVGQRIKPPVLEG